MVGSFEFKGIESKSLGLICQSVSRPILPAMRPQLVEIYGKSGVYDFHNNDYGTRQITMHIAYMGESYQDLRSRAREIAEWLNTRQWSKLIINDEPDKYYLARVYGPVNLETLYRSGQADIAFECQPFAYMVANTGSDPTWEEADFPWLTDLPWNMVKSYQFSATGVVVFAIKNPGTQEIGADSPQGSKFDIIIAGSWTTLSLSMNGKILIYTEAGSGELIIDSVEMEVKLNGVNKLSVIDGDIDSFLTVLPGNNIITVSGSGINVNVTIDFVPMWL